MEKNLNMCGKNRLDLWVFVKFIDLLKLLSLKEMISRSPEESRSLSESALRELRPQGTAPGVPTSLNFKRESSGFAIRSRCICVCVCYEE